MKLQFDLLWIENEFSEQEKEVLALAATEAGFELRVTNSKDGSDLEKWAVQQNNNHTFDLVLLDLKLANNIRGNELAPQVRQLFRFTPILFYSSEPANRLREMMAEEGIEGVFCSQRKDFTSRAGELIKDYGHALNRLPGMRGLAMEVVSEVDTICRTMISHLALGQEEEVVVYLEEKVRKHTDDVLQRCKSHSELEDWLGDYAVDSTKTFDLFRHLLKNYIKRMPKGAEKDNLLLLKNVTKDYCNDVIEIRNALGHTLGPLDANEWSISYAKGEKKMTAKDFPQHRTTFLRNLRAIRDISKILGREE